jgi:hypothetical protein
MRIAPAHGFAALNPCSPYISGAPSDVSTRAALCHCEAPCRRHCTAVMCSGSSRKPLPVACFAGCDPGLYATQPLAAPLSLSLFHPRAPPPPPPPLLHANCMCCLESVGVTGSSRWSERKTPLRYSNFRMTTTADTSAYSLTRLPAAGFTAMPWKNGGGVTREIAVCRHPEPRVEEGGAAAGHGGAVTAVGAPHSPSTRTTTTPFAWRLSMADLAGDGPFSQFPGIDRIIVLLRGSDVKVGCAQQVCEHFVTEVLFTPLMILS